MEIEDPVAELMARLRSYMYAHADDREMAAQLIEAGAALAANGHSPACLARQVLGDQLRGIHSGERFSRLTKFSRETNQGCVCGVGYWNAIVARLPRGDNDAR